MRHLWKIFFTGMLVSFLGSLPLGTLNIAAMQISISDGITAALLFSAGSLTAEIIYVRLSLVAMDWIRKQEKLFLILEWVTLAIVVVLAIASFYSAMHPSETKGSSFLSRSHLPHFILGLAMSAVSPMQIPFWFGWSTVLFTKKILLPRKDYYNSYIAGIGLGTFMGNAVFIFGGRFIAGKISNNQNIISWVIGGFFTITAIVQIWKIFKKKDAVHQIEHPEDVKRSMEEKIIHITERDK
jgi:threonine/homoserine/homoserine lactone efflux protein